MKTKNELIVSTISASRSPEIKLCRACKGSGQEDIISNEVPWTGKECDTNFVIGTRYCKRCEGAGRVVEITTNSVTHQAYRPEPLKPVKKNKKKTTKRSKIV